jgi:uncharacterized protein (DUF58 family)
VNLYPTRRAIALMFLGAPVALGVAAVAPHLWTVAAAWVLFVGGLLLAEAWLSPARSALRLQVRAPDVVSVNRTAPLAVEARFEGRRPTHLELAVGGDERIACAPARQWLPLADGQARAELALQGRRRGPGRIEGVWVRWRGPLGLLWRQYVETPVRPVLVTADLEAVREESVRLFSRDAPVGVKPDLDTGVGSEFHALREFQSGMDRRGIDWKQSARHGKLVAREFRTERYHNIVLALDSGRLMSAPAKGGTRIDRAASSALLLAFVSLKLGDRVSLFAFDAKPRVASGMVTGVSAFGSLQRLASSIDYSTEETNFTLGLTTLAGQLDRRALVVTFTDFVDPTSAELMVEHVGRLARTHLVVLVTFRDDELEALAGAEPADPEAVSCAVVAGALLKQRQSVMLRLRRLGVQVLEGRAEELGPALVSRYLEIMRRELV